MNLKNKILAKKEIFPSKEDLLITKQDLIDTIDRAKNETILWIVLMGVLQFIGCVLTRKFM